MPVLFPRYLNVAAKVTVSDFLGSVSFDVENLDGDGLYMEWSVERQLSTQADTGSVRIYNLGSIQQGLIQSIVKSSQGSDGSAIGNVEIAVGWERKTFSLMKGQIWKLQAKLYEDPDVVTNIEFGVGLASNRDSQPLPTAVAEILVTDQLAALASRFRPPRLLDVDQVTSAVVSSPNGLRAIAGNDPSGTPAKQTFDTIVSGLGPGYSWGYNQNGLIVVFNRGLLSIAPGTLPQIVRARTGLLSFAEEDNGSITFDALANPAIAPGGIVSIIDRFDKPVGQPVMRVESATFTGDTRSGSLMSAVARPLSVI